MVQPIVRFIPGIEIILTLEVQLVVDISWVRVSVVQSFYQILWPSINHVNLSPIVATLLIKDLVMHLKIN